MTRFKWLWVLKVLFFGALFVLAFVGGTMWLWNHLAVELFGLPTITFVQTIGLMLLGRLITGGFKGGPMGGKPNWQTGPPWKRARLMREKWYKMTPDEREEFKKKWADCGPGSYWNADKKAENTPPAAE